MHKNQKLGLVAIAFLAAGFGTWFLANYEPGQAQAAPVKLKNQLTAEQRREKQKNMVITEIPEDKKKVEHALEDRWGHLGEEVLTAASVDKNGDTVYFDKKVIAGLRGDGKPVYAQGFHRSYLFNGPVIRDVKYEPMSLTLKGKTAGSGFLMKALKDGRLIDRDKIPAPKSPASNK